MRELDAPKQRASPRGETFPLHQVPAKRDQAASDTESAPIRTGLPGTHKASCALPRCTAAGGRLRTRPKRGAHKRARCGASGDTGQRGELFFPHMRNSRRVALCGVSHRRKVESEVTRQRGELSSPICGTAAARNCRGGAYRLMEARFRGTRQRAIRRRRLHRQSHYDQLRPPTMWSERRYPLMIERSKGRKVYGITQEKASMTRNRSPQMLSTCSSALCTSSGPRLSAASAWASVSA